MQLDLFPVTFNYTYKFEPCTNSWTGEPTGDTRLTVWTNENDPCNPRPRRWIEGIYESSSMSVLRRILKNDHPTAVKE